MEPGDAPKASLYRTLVPLVLASASPRRQRMLAGMGLEFTVAPARIDEQVAAGETPEAHVRRLAAAKAGTVAAERPGECVLAADTVVALDGAILGKPADPAAAEAMLARLSGRWHEVWTGYAVVLAGRRRIAAVATGVRFIELAPALIRAYAATGEPLDKAGAYGIQGLAAAFVAEIRGSYTNVVGLPLARVMADLAVLGAVACRER